MDWPRSSEDSYVFKMTIVDCVTAIAYDESCPDFADYNKRQIRRGFVRDLKGSPCTWTSPKRIYLAASPQRIYFYAKLRIIYELGPHVEVDQRTIPREATKIKTWGAHCFLFGPLFSEKCIESMGNIFGPMLLKRNYDNIFDTIPKEAKKSSKGYFSNDNT